MTSVVEKKQELDALIQRTEELIAEHENALSRSKELNAKLEYALEFIKENPPIVDGIQLAYQTGRLDWVSIILTVLAILIAIAAFWGFNWVQVQSGIIAKEVAKKTAEDKTKSIVEKRAKKELREAVGRLEDRIKSAADSLIEHHKDVVSEKKLENIMLKTGNAMDDSSADSIAEDRGEE